MKRVQLGRQGLEVSAQGLGCMGMSEFYGATDEAESIATIHRALDLGVTFLDTADVYGTGANERLVGEAIAGRRDEAHVATKFGNERRPDGSCGRDQRTTRVRARGVRRVPPAARRRRDRPLLPAPGRQHRPDRGDGRRDGLARRGRQGQVPRALGGGARDDQARARRTPDQRAPDRVLALVARRRGGGAPDGP